jgi:hypothetical protein
MTNNSRINKYINKGKTLSKGTRKKKKKGLKAKQDITPKNVERTMERPKMKKPVLGGYHKSHNLNSQGVTLSDTLPKNWIISSHTNENCCVKMGCM